MQRNWIGRSEGAEVIFRCEELGIDFPVFTTRPGHPLRRDLLRARARAPRARAPRRRHRARAGGARVRQRSRPRESAEERGAEDRAKTGVPLGRTVTNPVNGEQIPMFVADYVLMEYGTGALMAVPAHDQRDFEFAKTFEPRRSGRVVAAADGAGEEADGRRLRRAHRRTSVLVNSGEFTA